MADVRCPMCGMQNPTDVEVCSFCNARLKPIQIDPQTDAFGEDLPDWLQSLRISGESEPQASSQEEPLPDWLNSLREQPVDMPLVEDFELEDQPPLTTPDTASVGREIPDWLRDLGSETRLSDESKAEHLEEAQLSPEESEWWSRVDQARDDSMASNPETPDWLSDLEKTTPQIEPAKVPDWFTQEAEDHQAPEGVLPDWLFSKEMPDELREKEQESRSAEEPPVIGDELELPNQLEEKEFQELESLPEQPTAMKEKELLDWLSGVLVETPGTKEKEATQEPRASVPFIEHAEEEIPLKTLSTEQIEGDLDWLKELEATFSGFHPDTGIPLDAGTTASLTLGGQGMGGLEIIPQDALPSWLSEVTSEEEALEAHAPQGEMGLMPAELPGWLKAMRPIEAIGVSAGVVSEAESEKVESAGPLTGLKGALPAEPDISQTQKPSAYSIKLQATEAQEAHADLLKRMIASEGETRPLSARPVITSQHALRIAIATILFFAVLLPLVTGIPQVGIPVAAPEVSAVALLIEGLPTGAPVLLAIDYEPGLSGEMDTITALVVDHLMERGVYLALVSTIPTGPSQAEHLLKRVNQSGGHAYSMPDEYVNLGFVPGGAVGLLRFAEAPREILPFDMLGKPAWDDQPLVGVATSSNFSMVIIATENPDTARSWIEQVKPVLKETPLILIASAQADPILRPYYEAIPRQVQGMVSGLMGGVAYESQLGKSSDAGVYWPSFNVSMLFAGLLIAVGGVINLASAYVARRRAGGRRER